MNAFIFDNPRALTVNGKPKPADANGKLTPQTPLDAALTYAAHGFPIFPCVPGKKTPLTNNGFKAATTDAEQIRRWWTNQPDANIGLPTDGLLVVDIDGPNNPWPVVPGMETAPIAITPRGGRHVVFRQPVGCNWRNTTSKLAPNVDTRANGGYIVVAPSVVDGKSYRWEHELPPRDELPEPPPALVGPLDDRHAYKASAAPNGKSTHHPGILPRYVQAALDAELGKVAMATEGERNATLNKAAFALGQFVGGGVIDRACVEDRLADAAARAGLDSLETTRTIRSGIEAGIVKPREVPPGRLRAERGTLYPAEEAEADDTDLSDSKGDPDKINLTDKGNGQRLVRQHGRDLRHCWPWRKWLSWDGRRWRIDDSGIVTRFAKKTIVNLFAWAVAKMKELQKAMEEAE